MLNLENLEFSFILEELRQEQIDLLFKIPLKPGKKLMCIYYSNIRIASLT
ncbi:hypothetical protein [Leptospira noguchii]